MMPDHSPSPHEPRGAADFASTQWSLVLRAGDRNDRAGQLALAALCERYWLPLYEYVRRRRADLHEAQDLTQAFSAWLHEQNLLAAASADRGRFRAFLLTALKNFLANDWQRAQAQKRGGGAHPLSLDWQSGESRLNLEPAHDLTPERQFDRVWALTLLDLVLQRLQGEYDQAGKARQFEPLKPALAGGKESLPYAELALELNTTEAAARQAASRLRKRYREILRTEIVHTVANPTDPAEVDDEIRALFAVLGV